MQTDAALMYDAVYVFAHALEQVEPSYSRMRLVNLSCDGEQAWAFGSSLYSYINLVFCTTIVIISVASGTVGGTLGGNNLSILLSNFVSPN